MAQRLETVEDVDQRLADLRAELATVAEFVPGIDWATEAREALDNSADVARELGEVVRALARWFETETPELYERGAPFESPPAEAVERISRLAQHAAGGLELADRELRRVSEVASAVDSREAERVDLSDGNRPEEWYAVQEIHYAGGFSDVPTGWKSMDAAIWDAKRRAEELPCGEQIKVCRADGAGTIGEEVMTLAGHASQWDDERVSRA